MRRREIIIILICGLLIPIGCKKNSFSNQLIENGGSNTIDPLNEVVMEERNNEYTLIVNGDMVYIDPLDILNNENAPGFWFTMIPMVSTFRGIGYEVTDEGSVVKLCKDGSPDYFLDLNSHTLIDSSDPDYNYFLIMPGDTNKDFVCQRCGDELWVCIPYALNAFQLINLPCQIKIYEKEKTMMLDFNVSREPSP